MKLELLSLRQGARPEVGFPEALEASEERGHANMEGRGQNLARVCSLLSPNTGLRRSQPAPSTASGATFCCEGGARDIHLPNRLRHPLFHRSHADAFISDVMEDT